MNELETLTYLVGTPSDRCRLLHTISDKEKLVSLFNHFKEDSAFSNQAHLYLLLNPQLPEGVLDHSSFTKYIDNLSDKEYELIADYLIRKEPISPESLKLLIDTLGDNLADGLPKQVNSKIFQPFFVRNKGIILPMKVITRIIQHHNSDPKLFLSLENHLLSPKPGINKHFIPYLLKFSCNQKFLNFYLEKLQKSPHPKMEDYSLNHFVVNPHLTAKQIKIMESKFKLKPKQKRLLSEHPNRKPAK